ncbi:MAG: hypothetical protein KKG76_06510, partial [Euryarchaeota archaeon]|nr:hypothetical protein [Euryarchaeota archaeon]
MTRSSKPEKKPIEQYEHKGMDRCNNPPVGLVTPETDSDSGKKTYAYDPHIDLSPQRAQRTQSSAIPVTMYENAAASRLRTRMTQIARIFTDPCASASTVTPVDCVHTYASALAYVDVYSAQSVFYFL